MSAVLPPWKFRIEIHINYRKLVRRLILGLLCLSSATLHFKFLVECSNNWIVGTCLLGKKIIFNKVIAVSLGLLLSSNVLQTPRGFMFPANNQGRKELSTSRNNKTKRCSIHDALMSCSRERNSAALEKYSLKLMLFTETCQAVGPFSSKGRCAALLQPVFLERFQRCEEFIGARGNYQCL